MIYIIAALSQNNQIGLNNQMPWHLPEDLHYFKTVTTGHTVIMGRKTFESIGHPLTNRKNIVLTQNPNFTPDGVQVIHTLKEALELCQELPEVFIIGGGEIYRAFMPFATKLYLTLIPKVIIGNTTFPDYQNDFRCTHTTPSKSSFEDGTTFSFTIWERK